MAEINEQGLRRRSQFDPKETLHIPVSGRFAATEVESIRRRSRNGFPCMQTGEPLHVYSTASAGPEQRLF